MSLVSQTVHPMVMGQLYDRLNIGTNPVIGRIVYQYRLRVRIFLNGLFYIFYTPSQRNSQPVLSLGIYITRDVTSSHPTSSEASVDVYGKHYFLSTLSPCRAHSLT